MYHIKPDSGDVGVCRAKQGNCPFGSMDEHFTTREAAQSFFEKQQSEKPQFTGSSTDGGPITYDFPERNLQLAIDSIEKANRRLEKAGVAERFTYDAEEYMATTENRLSGMIVAEPRVKLTVNTPAVKFDGYTFMAAVEKAEAGFVVKTAAGYDLHGYVPDDLRCQACGKAMARQKTYLVEDKEGNLIQVGSSCVKNYFGVEPSGLWSLTFDPIKRATDHDSWERTTSIQDSAVPTSEVLAYALAVSDGGENFISSTIAREYGGDSTADLVKTAINGQDKDWQAEMYEKAQGYQDEAKRLLEVIKNSDQTSDYGRNMATIASGEYTRWNHMNLLVSGLSALAREKREAAKKLHAERWGDPQPGFMAPVGTKLKGQKLRVYSTYHTLEDDPYSYNGREVEKTRVNLRDEDNHEVIWWAPRRINFEEGAEVTLKSGNVKKHGAYRGVDQTTIGGRVRFEEEEPPTSEDD